MEAQKNKNAMKKLVLSLIILLSCNFSFGQTNNAFGDNMRAIDSTFVGPGYQYIFAILNLEFVHLLIRMRSKL